MVLILADDFETLPLINSSVGLDFHTELIKSLHLDFWEGIIVCHQIDLDVKIIAHGYLAEMWRGQFLHRVGLQNLNDVVSGLAIFVWLSLHLLQIMREGTLVVYIAS